jgi:hypothetical protein
VGYGSRFGKGKIGLPSLTPAVWASKRGDAA